MTHRITLKTLKGRPDLAHGFKGSRVRIWSGEHCLWWREDSKGYTADEAEAGIYEWSDALKRSEHCGDEKRITYVGVAP